MFVMDVLLLVEQKCQMISDKLRSQGTHNFGCNEKREQNVD